MGQLRATVELGQVGVRLKTMADAELDAISWAVAELTSSKFTAMYLAA
jgi:hypothetical protein